MSARIIAKDYFVSKSNQSVLINGKVRTFNEVHVNRKPIKAQSNSYDRLVFNLIHADRTFDWTRITNNFDIIFDGNTPAQVTRAIDRHCV